MSKALAKLDAMRVAKPTASAPKTAKTAEKPATRAAAPKKAAPAPKKEPAKPEIEDYMPVVEAKAEEKPAIEEFMPVVDAPVKTVNDDLAALLKKPETPVAGAHSYYIKDETHAMLAAEAKKRGVSASRLLEAIIRKELTH